MEQKSTLLKSALVYGLYAGLISILLSVIIWAGGLLESLGMWGSALIGILSLVVTLIILIIFTRMYRDKELGGVITFGQAFQFGILVIVVSIIVSSIYTFIFQSFIDPDYMVRVMQSIQDKTLAYLERMGASDAQIDKTMARFAEVPTVFKSIKQGLISGLIGGAILSLISSAVIKKNKKESSEVE